MAFKNRYYPHLLPVDIPVWERYLALHKDLYDHIEYDVRVGTGREPGVSYPIHIRGMALNLSRRRIDAVGHTAQAITVIEITKRAGLKAIGQLMVYPILYQQSFEPTVPIKVLLVAEELNTDILRPLMDLQLPFMLLPKPFDDQKEVYDAIEAP